MKRLQGFPLFGVTIWIEDLGDGQYRVWHSHNGSPQTRYNERVTRDPVAASQEERNDVLAVYAHMAAQKPPAPTPAVMKARRVEAQAMGVSMFLTAACVVTLLVCCISLGPSATATLLLVVWCLRGLA